MVHNPKKSHLIANALFRLLASNEPNEMPNQIIDAPLFLLQLTWLQEIHDYLQTKDFLASYTLEQKQNLILRALPYALQQGKLYK
jgi:hypothetical protein